MISKNTTIFSFEKRRLLFQIKSSITKYNLNCEVVKLLNKTNENKLNKLIKIK